MLSVYYSLYVFCRGCQIHPDYRSRTLYITINFIKFGLNCVLVIMSLMHGNDLNKFLKEENKPNPELSTSADTFLLKDNSYFTEDSNVMDDGQIMTSFKARVKFMRTLYFTTGFTFLLINVLYTIVIPMTLVYGLS